MWQDSSGRRHAPEAATSAPGAADLADHAVCLLFLCLASPNWQLKLSRLARRVPISFRVSISQKIAMAISAARLVAIVSLSLILVEARHKKLGTNLKPSKAVPPRVTSPCDLTIPGYWTGFFPGPLGDEYQLTWGTATNTWTAVYIDPIPGGWKNASGVFGTDNTTVSVVFDSGLKLTGTVDASCSTIAWDNDSLWKSVAPVPCSAVIPGPWAGFDPQPTGAEYSLSWSANSSNGSWEVLYLNAPVGPSWTAGVGQFSADNLTTSLLLNSGSSLHGSVTGGCSTITWNDGSIWKATPAPPTITDVHIVAMNHLDVGCVNVEGRLQALWVVPPSRTAVAAVTMASPCLGSSTTSSTFTLEHTFL